MNLFNIITRSRKQTIKHGKLISLSLVILLSLYSCDSGNKAKPDIPEWYLNPPEDPDYIYGIGTAKAESDGEAILLAEDRARASIAGQFGTFISSYGDNVGDINVHNDELKFIGSNNYAESRINSHIYMSDVISRAKTKDGTWYCLVSASKDQNLRRILKPINDNLSDILRLNAAELLGMESKKQEVIRNGEIIPVFQKETPSIPDWVINPAKIQKEDVVFGLGAAKLDNDNVSIEMAKERARRSLARSLHTEVIENNYEYNDYYEFNTSVTSIYDHTVFLTQLNLYTKSKDGTWWVLLQSPRPMYSLENKHKYIEKDEALRKMDEAFRQIMEMEFSKEE